MVRKKNAAADIVGGFIVLVDDVNMDTEDSVPDPQQQPDTPDTTADPLEDAEASFTIVTKVTRRYRHRAMIDACALPNCSLDKLADSIQRQLRGIATVVGSAELIHLPQEDDTGPVVPFVVFEILNDTQLTAIARSGITINMGLEDTPTKFLYRPYTMDHQRRHESRRVLLKAMAFNTTFEDVKEAMGAWGHVAHIKMGFNPQKSMRIATVTFTDPATITNMIIANTTCVSVGRNGDVACVAQMGDKIFEGIPTVDGVFPCQGITMPLDTRTKRRKPHAFVYFESEEQWEYVRQRVFEVERYKTAWVDVHTALCRVCSSPDHKQADCPIQQRRDTRNHMRKVHLHNMQPNSRQAAAPTATSTPTKAAKAKAPAANPSRTNASSPSNTNKSVSYSAALKGREKTMVPCTPPEQLQQAGKGKERATTSTAGPSRSFEDRMAEGKELRHRLADLTRICEMDKQKWNAFQLRFDHIVTRVAAVVQRMAQMDTKIDRVLAALLPADTQSSYETDMDLSPIADTPHTDPSIIIAATPLSAHPTPTSPPTVIGKRGSTTRAEPSVIAPKPHTLKMDSHEQLQLKFTAMQAELDAQLAINTRAADIINMYTSRFGDIETHDTNLDNLDQGTEQWEHAATVDEDHHSDPHDL
ncbi:hypothetical protein BGZ67_009561 [Mortierella alpina]|nr:hypothetical protein BGZ67_009561 [Mortierella alpina]